jgi:hypothetical protein
MKKLKQKLDFKLVFIYFPLILFLILVLIAQIDATISSKGIWSVNEIIDPYVKYYQNNMISNIQVIAICIDSIILTLVLFKVAGLKNMIFSLGLMFFLLLAVFLIWFELWYGSTFYYGEVRDKQGLPLTLNNIGFVGSILFSLYYLINLRFFKKLKTISKISIVIILILGHWTMVKLLEAPWNFVLSQLKMLTSAFT